MNFYEKRALKLSKDMVSKSNKLQDEAFKMLLLLAENDIEYKGDLFKILGEMEALVKINKINLESEVISGE